MKKISTYYFTNRYGVKIGFQCKDYETARKRAEKANLLNFVCREEKIVKTKK